MLHSDLQCLLDEIDAAEADAKSIVAGLTDTQINWQPDNGQRWSIVQCLDHLAKLCTLYGNYFLPVLEAARTSRTGSYRGLQLTWFGRKFVSSQSPPPKTRLKAPAKIKPGAFTPASAAVESYMQSHEAYRKLVLAANDVDVNRVSAPNPFFKLIRIRITTVLMVVPAHERRHLWQARQVLSAPGFPQ